MNASLPAVKPAPLKSSREKSPEGHWRRAIILLDMNAFFASIEQLDHPEWRGRAVAVTNGEQGSCIITCSYEARAFGIKTGMRLQHARSLCPDLIQAPSRVQRYAEVSQRIMQSLTDVTPDIEVFSIDEAFLDVTACQQLHGGAIACAHLAKQRVFEVSGLHCSVGLSSDKTTAKYAAKLQKPNGLQIIYPQDVKARLQHVAVGELCGIATGTERFLAAHGAYTCGDVAKLPISLLARRFGHRGRLLWLMCRGENPEAVKTQLSAAKSLGHSKMIPPNTRNKDLLLTYFMHLCEKLASRLRYNQLHAQSFSIGFRDHSAWFTQRYRLLWPSDDGRWIYQCLVQRLFEELWRGQGVHQVQITALDPSAQQPIADLFLTEKQRQHLQERRTVNTTQDEINKRFGDMTLTSARLLKKINRTAVISPAWSRQKRSDYV